VTVRRSDDEVVVFDSTGTALQDVAAAAAVYERATGGGAPGDRRGRRVALGA
jgi:ornithine cyclodeaminase/alanine dehydrogenase-like protein (mu-crystallin family)